MESIFYIEYDYGSWIVVSNINRRAFICDKKETNFCINYSFNFVVSTKYVISDEF